MTTKVPPTMLVDDYTTTAEAMAIANIVAPIGAIIDYAGTAEPAVVQGVTWLFPYGQAISRTTYATLFARVGVTYGVGDGSTTFNLPDYRGRIGAGQDDMGGTSANRITLVGAGFDGDVLGNVGGSELLHAHSHGLTDPGHTHLISPPTSSSEGGQGLTVTGTGGTEVVTPYNSGSASTGITMANAGTGSSQNVQPTIIVNKLIRVL
jgi:microcystin-dependent protein